jgi:hypothetical protein
MFRKSICVGSIGKCHEDGGPCVLSEDCAAGWKDIFKFPSCHMDRKKHPGKRRKGSLRVQDAVYHALPGCSAGPAGLLCYLIVRPHYFLVPLQPLWAGFCSASPFTPPQPLFAAQPLAIMLVPARRPAIPIPARNFLSFCASMVHLLSCMDCVHDDREQIDRGTNDQCVKHISPPAHCQGVIDLFGDYPFPPKKCAQRAILST